MIAYWLDNLFSRLKGEALVRFTCNICSRNNVVATYKISREERACVCGSTVRQRAIIDILSHYLFGESRLLKNFTENKDIVGIDFSGASNYATRLSKKFNYKNTFLHKEPYLDITNIDTNISNTCDFVISSDVFEHIVSPVSIAFKNTFSILKPGGLLLLTVPYTKNGNTIEHFTNLYDYKVATINNKKILINTGSDGSVTEFDNLVFHGGEGETLEMRVFSESGILSELTAAGFIDIQIHADTVKNIGVYWSDLWSLPITARKTEVK